MSGWTLTRLTTANFRDVYLWHCLYRVGPDLPYCQLHCRPRKIPRGHLNPNSSLYQFHCPIANCFCNYMTILQQTEGNSSTQLMMVEELLLLARLLPNRPWFALPSTNPVTQSTSWATATMQSGWDANATEIGTPGSIPSYFLIDKEDVNQTGINTLIEPRNWGSLKRDSF